MELAEFFDGELNEAQGALIHALRNLAKEATAIADRHEKTEPRRTFASGLDTEIRNAQRRLEQFSCLVEMRRDAVDLVKFQCPDGYTLVPIK